MLSLSRSSVRGLIGVSLALVAAAAFFLLVRSGAARAQGAAQLQQQIGAGQNRISGLSGAVSAESKRIGQLGGQISGLQRQISSLQARIGPEVNQLFLLRAELSSARSRLSQLEAFEVRAESVLARQLVGTYETGAPDLVTIVLEAKGFQELLDQLSFEQRIQHQDANEVATVRGAREAVSAQAVRLGALEVHQQNLTNHVLAQRNQLYRDQLGLVGEQVAVGRARAVSSRQLAAVQAQVGGLKAQLSKIEAAQAAAAARAAAQSTGGAVQSASTGGGTQVASSGGFTFPLPKGAAAPPSAWSPDQGVDISAPGGTPEYAVCSGTIVLHGIGGFGPWAPVIHCDSPLGGYNYVYYGHAGPANQLPIGTHVSQGQVMSEIGPGIVGISSGPHLEIGFCDASGAPIGSQTAGQMLALLQAAYNS
jgi:murein DD-endopeptidase MepM/ murein hydrolase activator NlpD